MFLTPWAGSREDALEIDAYQLLQDNPILLTFIVIGSGYLGGRLKIGTVEVGSTTGVLLAGLLFGHLGFPNQPAAATFGFTLFIFSVGLQAGPSFFSAFLEDGAKYIVLAIFVGPINYNNPSSDAFLKVRSQLARSS